MPKTSPIRSAVLVELRLVTDRHRQRPMASTADAQHLAVKTSRARCIRRLLVLRCLICSQSQAGHVVQQHRQNRPSFASLPPTTRPHRKVRIAHIETLLASIVPSWGPPSSPRLARGSQGDSYFPVVSRHGG